MSSVVEKMCKFSNKRQKIVSKTSNKLKKFHEQFLINWQEGK